MAKQRVEIPDDEFIRLYMAGKDSQEIAEHFGANPKSVKNKIRKLKDLGHLGEPDIIPRKISGNTRFDEDLGDMVRWWRERKHVISVIRGSYEKPKKTRRTYFMYDDVHEAIVKLAESEGATVTDIVDRALRLLLERVET